MNETAVKGAAQGVQYTSLMWELNNSINQPAGESETEQDWQEQKCHCQMGTGGGGGGGGGASRVTGWVNIFYQCFLVCVQCQNYSMCT